MKKTLCAAGGFAALLLAGCQSAQFYDGAPQPKIATAEFYVDAGSDIVVTRIDSREDEILYVKRAYLLPGSHTIVARTNVYYRQDDPLRLPLIGRFEIGFNAKAGKTYMLADDKARYDRRNSNSTLCMYEEDQDDPKAIRNFTNEQRTPGPAALQIACDKVEWAPD